MPQASAKKAARPPAPEAPPSGLPSVRLEVRAGGGRPTVYEVGDGGFLIGGVPGCDLRLPGGSVAPVVCLISRHGRGASLRKLAPVQAVAVNGKPSGSTYLNHGDRINLGTVEITASVSAGSDPPGGELGDAAPPEIAAREAELQSRAGALEKERKEWQRLRGEIETECRRQTEAAETASLRIQKQEDELAAARSELGRREEALRAAQEELDRLRNEFGPQIEEADRQHVEARAIRKQMAQIREQLYERYRNRRDRMRQKQKAIGRAAKRLQERKRDIDEAAAKGEAVRKELELGQAENEARAEQLRRDRLILEEEHQRIMGRQVDLQNQLAARVQECEEREQKVVEDRAALERGQKQHQSDLVRLDRIQGQLEQRQKQLEARAMEVDKRYEQLQRDLRDLEEQAVQMDEFQAKQAAETEKLTKQKEAHDAAAAQLEQRAAALEGQQAMLATLRTRVERMREEVRRQEEALSDQRVMQEASETDLKARHEEAQRLREDLDNDRLLHHEERRRFEDTRATMDAAVAQLREAQQALEAREQELGQRQAQQETTAAEQIEQAGLLAARTAQLEELQIRLSADRKTLRDRETALAKAEQTLTSLQEQLRRRSEELGERQNVQAEQEQKLRADAARLDELTKAAEQERHRRMAELAARAAEIETLSRDLAEREAAVGAESERLREMEHSLAGQRQALAAQRMAFDADRQAASEEAARLRREFEATRAEALELIRSLPDLETRAAVGMDRLLRAREQLREHLAEVHGYARHSREDLEGARQHVQGQADRVRAEELAMQVARDEHRMAVAAFRQQLAEWQARVAEMKQLLMHGETRLERRQAEVREQAEQVASTSARLAQQAEELQEQERQVAERRSEMDRHLSDMQEWYRRKLRELSGVDAAAQEVAVVEADAVFALLGGQDKPAAAAQAEGGEPGVLPMNGEPDPADRQLGDLLRSLELVDGDTLAALLQEARRQRRSLRQLLLAGNYLTLYQMALIEAGNLDGLVLGPARVIDRLQSGPREAVYRVFDPRRNGEALLRWLAESEMHDAVHPDEFRQRFGAAAAVRHVHVAATYEVLEIADRPAVLQEWLAGLPGPDWPALSSAPGVWFRLLSQAALGLRTAHDAGMIHGALTAASFVCTPDGVVKLCGLGEPRWLAAAPPEDAEAGAAADLGALGVIAAGWAAAAPRKGKGKAMPEALENVLARLTGQAGPPYTSAAELLEDLDRVSADAPANATAWERFVREVREQAAAAAWRRSA